VFVLLLTTSILGPYLTERFAPRMLAEERKGDHAATGRTAAAGPAPPSPA
jgi:hypothetical protein